MTIEQANQYFAALPEGFAPAEELRAALPAAAQQVAYVGVAGTAGKTAAAALTAAVLQAAGFVTGLYRAGCEPLEQRVRINGEPVADALLCAAAETLSRAKPLPRAAAELAAAAACFGAAGCRLAVVELPDAGLAEALSHMPVCVVTSIGPDGVSRSVERSAALAAGVMREGAICVTAPEQPKAALSELIVAAGREDCELVVPDPDDITFLEAEKFTSRVDYGGYTVPLAFLGRHARVHWRQVSLRATSIGAWFSMLALQEKALRRALFVSPIVDMEDLIGRMMQQANVTEEQLKAAGEIPTTFGETLSWPYLCWVREHPFRWRIPTQVLYGEADALTSYAVLDRFKRATGAQLTLLADGEHWFHTETQLAVLQAWEGAHL